MADDRPDFSLESVPGERGLEKPALFLVRYFQVNEAYYMKPPLAEQLLEPDGKPGATAGGVVATEACTCNAVCTCVPVSTCACNTVCTCNTVSSTYGVSFSFGNTADGEVSVAPKSSKARTSDDLRKTRTWTGRNGNTVRGQFVRIHENAVILKAGSRVLRVAFDEFSAADQELLRSHGYTVTSTSSGSSRSSSSRSSSRGRSSRSRGRSTGGGGGGYWAPCF